MSELNRRRFLGALSATVIGGVGVARDVLGGPPQTLTAVAAAVASPPRAAGEVVAGALLPPPYVEKWLGRHARVIAGLNRMERRFETLWPLPLIADHYLLELERV